MTDTTHRSNLAAIALIIFGAIIVVPRLFAASGMPGFGLMGSGVWDNGLMLEAATPGWMPLFWTALLLVGLGAIVVGLYLVIRSTGGNEVETGPAMEELRHASARGEFVDEEHEARRERIEREG